MVDEGGRAQVVLADRRGRQVQAQRGHLPGDPGHEGVAVGTGPEAVGLAPGVGRHGGLDLVDHGFRLRAPVVREQLRIGAIPEHVGRLDFVGDHGVATPAGPPADDVIGGVAVRAGAFDRDPRVDAEGAAPAHDARAIDLHDRSAIDGGVGCLPCALLPGLVPGRVQIQVAEGQHADRAQQQQCDQDQEAQRPARPARRALLHRRRR